MEVLLEQACLVYAACPVFIDIGHSLSSVVVSVTAVLHFNLLDIFILK